MWPWKSFCLISPQLSSWKAPTQIESVAAKCQGAQPGSLSPEGSEGPGGALGPYPTPQKPEHLPDCRRLLPFCSLSSGHSASAQGGTHSSPMTLPTPPPGRRAPLRTPPLPLSRGRGTGMSLVEPVCRWGLPPVAGIKRELRGPRAGEPRG